MAAKNECQICFDTNGLCGEGDRKNNILALTLSDDYEEITCIPCYARVHFLSSYFVPKNDEIVFDGLLRTSEHFNFDVEVKNQEGLTYIFGEVWKQFLKVYNLQIGDTIYFNTDSKGPPTYVTTGKSPVIHPKYFRLSREKRDTYDSISTTDGIITTTDGIKLDWTVLDTIVTWVDRIDFLVSYHDAWDYVLGSTKALVHTLNWTNCGSRNKHLKIPRRFLPNMMAEYGDMTIVYHPGTKVKGSYSISVDDRRLTVNGWKEFMAKKPNLKTGDKILMLLYIAERGAYLFVYCLSDEETVPY